jgi:hypothetical protein
MECHFLEAAMNEATTTTTTTTNSEQNHHLKSVIPLYY